MKKSLFLSMMLCVSIVTANENLSSYIESPDASAIFAHDRLGPVEIFKMPKDCISSKKKVLARGAYLFHNLNGKKAKKNPPKGLSRVEIDKITGEKSVKNYGNCVACHNIEGAKGAGNIGTDLSEYNKNFIKTGIRSMQYVYQKISDPRMDNPDTHMTINLSTGLFNEREICDLSSYLVSVKK
ncbi:sulfur oxidation c-type cytochrome SoxX [Sulfurimonas sp. MAG313]|nr:sulfur oxidation c-type cytochrome SoxX [Sulfurimonas sp. MAG313]MDF1880546.1 sulfur oxidation c-type cytochrome SoxX [Sulfurimonas sp. MAG313]